MPKSTHNSDNNDDNRSDDGQVDESQPPEKSPRVSGQTKRKLKENLDLMRNNIGVCEYMLNLLEVKPRTRSTV